jgi:hypothetical protein
MFSEPDNFYVGYSDPSSVRANSSPSRTFGIVPTENHTMPTASSVSQSPTAIWIGFVVFLISMAVISRLPEYDKKIDPRNIDINGYNAFVIVGVLGVAWGGFKLLTNMLTATALGNTSAYQSFTTFVNYV